MAKGAGQVKVKLFAAAVAGMLASLPADAATVIQLGFEATLTGVEYNVNTLEPRYFHNEKRTYFFHVPAGSEGPAFTAPDAPDGFSLFASGGSLDLIGTVVGQPYLRLGIGCLGGADGSFPTSLSGSPCTRPAYEAQVHPRYLIVGGGEARGHVSAFGIRVIDESDLSAPFALAAAIPEPSTWALWILGFGLAGGLMRKQRRAALVC